MFLVLFFCACGFVHVCEMSVLCYVCIGVFGGGMGSVAVLNSLNTNMRVQIFLFSSSIFCIAKIS